jgi:peptidyl-prolyl cis-trans isomerase A (cyclophilin A)
MRQLVFALVMGVFATGSGWGQEETSEPLGISAWKSFEDEALTQPITLDAGTYAVFHTTDGDFLAVLRADKAPETVKNFVGLATGKKSWKHPITLADSDKPLYNNTPIYEILKDIAIRGGDPIGKGRGGPGYNLEKETSKDLGFDSPGILAMQLSGKQSNGSRWFVSLVPFPDYTGRYTVFGKVIGGLDVVRAISHKPTKRPAVPLEPTILNSVEIVEIPAGKRTSASFSTENETRVLTIEKEFQAVDEPKPEVKPEDEETSPTMKEDAETTVTDQATTGV